MKLAISTLVCPNWTLERIIEACAASGIAGIDFRGLGSELDITRLPAFNEQLPRTLATLEKHGIELPCYNTSIILITPTPDRWQMMLDECARYAELAAKTNTPSLRIFGGVVPNGMTRHEAITLARRHLRQLVKVTHATGCRVILETHDEWSAGDKLLELIGDLEPAQVGALWDAEHPWRHGESMAQTAAVLNPYLQHTHIKDTRQDGDKRLQTLLGEGDIPLNEFIAALRGIGYDRWVSLETEKRWVASAPEPEQSMPQFAQWMKAHALMRHPL